MTDVVEAMARGMWCAASGRIGGVWDFGANDIIDDTIREYWREKARAAIRACHDAGGLVVGKMPGEMQLSLRPMTTPEWEEENIRVESHNAALAAVRAAAVEVE